MDLQMTSDWVRIPDLLHSVEIYDGVSQHVTTFSPSALRLVQWMLLARTQNVSPLPPWRNQNLELWSPLPEQQQLNRCRLSTHLHPGSLEHSRCQHLMPWFVKLWVIFEVPEGRLHKPKSKHISQAE